MAVPLVISARTDWPRAQTLKASRLMRGRQPGRERQYAGTAAEATETADRGGPGASKRAEVQSVAHVSLGVVQIDECCLAEVVVGKLEMPDLGGDDGLGGGGQRGVPDGQPLVIGKISRLLLSAERFRVQLHRQHQVGLLDDLLAVQLEVREVLEQRVVGPAGRGEVPHLVLSEALGLRVDAQRAVVRDGHSIGSLPPLLNLCRGDCQRTGLDRVAIHCIRRGAHVLLGHQVGVDVVVG